MVAGEKRRVIIRELQVAGWQLARSSGKHDVFGCPCGSHVTPVPRHRELSPGVVANVRLAIRKG